MLLQAVRAVVNRDSENICKEKSVSDERKQLRILKENL